MIQKLINYLKKYHEANLWLEQAYIREEKKQALQAVATVQAGPAEVGIPYEAITNQPHIVFTHYDVGHNQEEKNKIQQLYAELEDLFRGQNLAVS